MMRPIGIGLAAALMMAALVGASTALTAPKDTSATDVPPLLAAAKTGAVTLLFSAHDLEHNNALVLKKNLEEQLKYG